MTTVERKKTDRWRERKRKGIRLLGLSNALAHFNLLSPTPTILRTPLPPATTLGYTPRIITRTLAGTAAAAARMLVDKAAGCSGRCV